MLACLLMVALFGAVLTSGHSATQFQSQTQSQSQSQGQGQSQGQFQGQSQGQFQGQAQAQAQAQIPTGEHQAPNTRFGFFQATKCDWKLIFQIYERFEAKGGVPQFVTDHDIACHQTEIMLKYTPAFFGSDDVTCAEIHHHSDFHVVLYKTTKNETVVHRALNYEFNGKIIEPYTGVIRINVAEYKGERLLYRCSVNKHATPGQPQFMIKGNKNVEHEEGIAEMERVLREELGITTTLKNPTETCSFVTDDIHIGDCTK